MPRALGFALVEELAGRGEQLVRPALPLGQRGTGAIDIGAGARVRPIEEQHAGPDVDGVVVPAVEVAVQAVDEQRVDLPVASGRVG